MPPRGQDEEGIINTNCNDEERHDGENVGKWEIQAP